MNFDLGMKLGLSHNSRNIDRGCPRTA